MAGFGIGRLLKRLERLDAELGGIAYLLGLAQNPALLRLAQPALAAAAHSFATRQLKVREFSTISYGAQTWERCHRVIVKAEHTAKGANPRFVVSNLDQFAPGLLYHAYCQRGQCEKLIKDFKNALKADRLSCTRFVANFLRLLEHAGAYRLMLALRRAAQALHSELGWQQFDTMRLRLLKVAAPVRQSVRRIVVQLPHTFPGAALFRSLALCTSGAGVT